MIELLNVEKWYGGKRVLRCDNLVVPVDAFVVVLGPSGSGKSTFLRVCSLLEAPERGVVRLELADRVYTSSGSARPWPSLSCVFQRQFLWPHLTVRDNILLPLNCAGIQDAGARVSAIVQSLNMGEFVERYPNQVSGGEAQRAALARALALQPNLILIDEAHTGLDLEQQRVLNRHLVMLREKGIGLVVVSHSLEFTRRYADHIVVIEQGEIVESGGQLLLRAPRSAFLRAILDK